MVVKGINKNDRKVEVLAFAVVANFGQIWFLVTFSLFSLSYVSFFFVAFPCVLSQLLIKK